MVRKERGKKNILAMAVGLLFSCIGMSPQTGLACFTFGQVSLMDGISLIPMLIGLFWYYFYIRNDRIHQGERPMPGAVCGGRKRELPGR